MPPIEEHPLQPFLPCNARLLMLGSFPPPRERWCMEFFYPNPQNDMWRLWGWIYFGDKNYFFDTATKKFRLHLLRPFLETVGVALYDTAQAVRRLKGNAQDAHLEVVRATDIKRLTQQLPMLQAIAVTGQKAADTIIHQLCNDPLEAKKLQSELKIGHWVQVSNLRLWRMPSSSRSYPLALEKKAEYYKAMLLHEGMLTIS